MGLDRLGLLRLPMTGLFLLGAVLSGEPGAFAQGKRPDLTQIKQFVFIVKENRTFDSYFGTFPGAKGTTTGMISTGQVIPLSHEPDVLPRDFGHSGAGIFAAYDWGRMDNFDLSFTCSVNGDELCFTQFWQQDIPNYFTYASTFVLGDQMFSSWAGASFPNHLYLIAAQSGGSIGNPSNGNRYNWGCDSDTRTTVQYMNSVGDVDSVYPCFDFQTLGDLLESVQVSWKYYAPLEGTPGYEWSSYDAIDHIRNGSLWSNVVPYTQFVTDAQAGSLPAVSWVVPPEVDSEHPPNSACEGENWSVTQLNAIMNSPQWDSTAVFVVWDDFGGLYDHEYPPTSPDELSYGPRVPLLIISPYAIPGYISHTQYEFSSFLKIVEERFGLPPLTDRDNGASDMLDSFNFSQTPLPPLVLQTRSCPVASTAAVNFLPQPVGSASPPKTVTVTNFGPSAMTINSIAASAGFSETSTCGATLGPGKNCHISVTFAPTVSGSNTGTLTITDSDPSSPQVVNLSGVGSQVGLAPGLIDFGTKLVGSRTAKTATITNQSGATLTISSMVASGDYLANNNCRGSVPPGGSCSIRVSFIPSTTGKRYGSITLSDSDGSSPQTLNLTGIGSYLSVSPAKLVFPDQAVGTSSLPLSSTLTNNGSSLLTISSTRALGAWDQPFLDFSQTNTCGGSLAAGASCTISVTFSPQIVGRILGNVTVFDSESGTSPEVVSLSGTGTSDAVQRTAYDDVPAQRQ